MASLPASKSRPSAPSKSPDSRAASRLERHLRQSLKPREEAFVLSYVQHFNAVQAHEDAGYKSSSHTARYTSAARVLNRSRVRKAIAAILSNNKRVLSVQEVLGELSDIAGAPWRDFLTIIRDKNGEEVDVKLNLKDKIAASELLLKAQHAFRDPLTKKLEWMLEREIQKLGRTDLLRLGEGSSSIPALPPASPSRDSLLDAEILDAEVIGKMEVPPRPGKAKR